MNGVVLGSSPTLKIWTKRKRINPSLRVFKVSSLFTLQQEERVPHIVREWSIQRRERSFVLCFPLSHTWSWSKQEGHFNNKRSKWFKPGWLMYSCWSLCWDADLLDFSTNTRCVNRIGTSSFKASPTPSIISGLQMDLTSAIIVTKSAIDHHFHLSIH